MRSYLCLNGKHYKLNGKSDASGFISTRGYSGILYMKGSNRFHTLSFILTGNRIRKFIDNCNKFLIPKNSNNFNYRYESDRYIYTYDYAKGECHKIYKFELEIDYYTHCCAIFLKDYQFYEIEQEYLL